MIIVANVLVKKRLPLPLQPGKFIWFSVSKFNPPPYTLSIPAPHLHLLILMKVYNFEVSFLLQLFDGFNRLLNLTRCLHLPLSTTSSLPFPTTTTTTTAAPLPDCNDDNKCTVDTYDVSEGKCVYTSVICEQGNVCDPSDGLCWPGPKGSCDGSVPVDLTNLPIECDSSDTISVTLPNADQSTKVFETKYTSGDFRGESSDGSTFQYIRNVDNQLVGSLADLSEHTVSQFGIDASGNQKVMVSYLSDYFPEADPIEDEDRMRSLGSRSSSSTSRNADNKSISEFHVLVVWTQMLNVETRGWIKGVIELHKLNPT